MKKILLTVLLLILVSACSQQAKEEIGLSKNIPDETGVVVNRPLTLPPDFDVTPVSEALKYQ